MNNISVDTLNLVWGIEAFDQFKAEHQNVALASVESALGLYGRTVVLLGAHP
jgi:hypothetical protein